jgi:hypothetical protein
MDEYKKEILETASPLVDLLEGDESVYSKIISKFDIKKVQKAYDFIINNPNLSDMDKNRLMMNSWRLHYRAEPPNANNFITPAYLGPVAESTYPRIKKVFADFMSPSEKRNLILFQSIGFGKSFTSSLITIYIAIHLSLMRNPKKFFGLNPASVLAQLLISYSLNKSSEVLLEPMINILEASPYFEKVRTKESMLKKEEEFQHTSSIDRIFWTTASPTSEISFSNGSNIKLSSSVHSLLGLAQPLYSKIKKPDGTFTTMGKLKVGDTIASPSEGETTVTGIYPQGKIPCYEITLEDGRTVRCSLNHLWKVGYKISSELELITDVVSLQFILDHPEYEFFIYDKEDCTIPEVPNATFKR